MPWWSWVIIWVVLVLALLGMLALMAWRLFRKGIAVLDALDGLASTTELLGSAGEDAERQRQELAILIGAEELRRRREYVRAAARERRGARRDSRIARGRALVKVDAASREWFSRY